MFFLKENGYVKLLEDHLKVYIRSERKCTAFTGGFIDYKNKKIYFIFPEKLLF